MECPVCRTSNASGINYCVKCGRSLEYFQESDFGYTDGQSVYTPSDLFTPEELNNTVEESDFWEQSGADTSEEYDFGGQSGADTFEEYDFGVHTENSDNYISFSEEPLECQPYEEYTDNSVLLSALPYSDMYGSSPQIIGYDQNGMPVYAQSAYQQPQFAGYDQNGIPVYAQPQIIGYDQNGMPVYQQNHVPLQNVPDAAQNADDTAEKFMDFLDDGENKSNEEPEDDFFGKSSDMGDVDLPVMDVGSLKKREHKKKIHMMDVEIQDAENLMPNDASKFNQKYMRQAGKSSSSDLGEKKTYGRKVSMGRTGNVDAEMLNPKMEYKSRIRMGDTSKANPDMSQRSVKTRKKFTMAEADGAVEAMPKKKKYVDELDLIELPDYMKKRRKTKKDKKDFPDMADL